MARTAANPRPRPNLNVKRPAPRRKAPVKEKVAMPARCKQPCCWKTAIGVKCTCDTKGLKGRCAAKLKARAKPVKRPLIKRTNQIIPGITAPLYRDGVVDGARAQFGLRAAGGGAQVPFSVTLPPRARKATAKMQASVQQRPKARKKAAPVPKSRGGRKIKVPARYKK